MKNDGDRGKKFIDKKQRRRRGGKKIIAGKNSVFGERTEKVKIQHRGKKVSGPSLRMDGWVGIKHLSQGCHVTSRKHGRKKKGRERNGDRTCSFLQGGEKKKPPHELSRNLERNDPVPDQKLGPKQGNTGTKFPAGV